MTTPKRGLLYHFTHLDNLAAVVRNGLLSDTLVGASGTLAVEAGQPAIKERRRQRSVPVGPGGVVADYVPFYFAARSPMLGSIHTGHVPSYQCALDELVYLVTDVDTVRDCKLRFVFTDRNAVHRLARFETDLGQLDDFVDWPLMEGRMWNNTPEEPDRMERRMAEFLVHERVPWEAFIGIAAANDTRCRDVEWVLSNVGVSATVRNRPNWYFP